MADLTLESLAKELAELRMRVQFLESRLIADKPTAPMPAIKASQVLEVPRIAMPPMEAARTLLHSLFVTALRAESPGDEEAFEAFRQLVHTDRRGTPLLDEELRSYKWRPLLTHCRQYLQKPEDPWSFVIERSQPEQVTEQTEVVRLYLKADKRMPPPITLKRDVHANNEWRIEGSSL